jgi:hypothetical protein
VLPPEGLSTNVKVSSALVLVVPALLQIAITPALTILGLTVTITVSLAEHPLAVTVSIYACVALGETVMEGVVAPVLHEYVPPPLPVKVTEVPAQIGAGSGPAFATKLA